MTPPIHGNFQPSADALQSWTGLGFPYSETHSSIPSFGLKPFDTYLLSAPDPVEISYPWRLPYLWGYDKLGGPGGSTPGTSGTLADKPITGTWVDFMKALGNGIESMDLDFHNVPVNRGINLCRFSEYTPRAKRPEQCTIEIQTGTRARVHGEVRPIKGMEESLITRVSVDFSPNVTYLNPIKGIPDLEIDGFSAVDPPKMTFDRKFPEKSVLDMSGGNYKYENPLNTGDKLATPFGSERAAAPGGHKYWMFRFQPINDSLVAGLEESVAGGSLSPTVKAGLGSLMLWAFLPTFGLSKNKQFDDFGIPFNTFPRKLGDLLAFLSPLFDPKKSASLREFAPFINPNTEFIDSQGHRQRIPEDPNEVDKINAERAKFGRPPIGRNRGTILDWIFTELAQDPKRLHDTPDSRLPQLTAHAKFYETRLTLPMGNLELLPGTDLKAYYYLKKAPGDKAGESRAQIGLRVDLKPLELGAVDLEIGGQRIKADSLKADKVVIDFGSMPGAGANAAKKKIPLTVRLEGVKAKGFQIGGANGALSLKAEEVQIGNIDFLHANEDAAKSWKLKMEEFRATNMVLQYPLGSLTVKKAHIPTISVVNSMTPDGKPRLLTVKIPTVNSQGEFTLAGKDSNLKLKMEGSSTLNDLDFYLTDEGTHQKLLATTGFKGGVDLATILHPAVESASFTTTEKDDSGETKHQVSGNIRVDATLPKDPAVKPTIDYTVKMDVPYIGFGTEGRLTMPLGGSTLRNGTVTVQPGVLKLEGDVDLNAPQLLGFGKGPTEIGKFILSENSPNIQGLKVTGRAKFEYLPDGWNLSSAPGGNSAPLKVTFKIKDSELSHHPDIVQDFIKSLPESKIIGTKVKLTEAEVEIEDIKHVEYRKFLEGGEMRGRLTSMKSGPITVHHIRASGSVWVNLLIWGFVRGFFPSTGTSSGSKVKRPDPTPLIQHLPEDVKKKLSDGDFFRLNGVDFQRKPNGDWTTHIDDLLLNIHEEGGRKQFGMIRVPEINAAVKVKPTKDPDKPEKEYSFDFGAGNFLLNIFLDDPQRGGSFRFYRWPK